MLCKKKTYICAFNTIIIIMKKHIFIVLFFLAALMAKAQTPYEQYSNDGISLDFKKIENLDFRVYLMYNLQQDRLFSYMQDEEDGVYLISSNNEGIDLADAFDTYYNGKLTDFSFFSKTDIDERIVEWKSGIASADMTSILMDWFIRQSRVDNEHCANSLPFCTSDVITFQAANTSTTANEPGMDDGCIGNSYNPSFYHMRIRVGGQFIIHMEGHDPNSNYERDIDFCMWGPYTEEEVMSHDACSNLSTGKIIDCCYSASYTEDCYLGYAEGEHHHNTGHDQINYHVPEVAEYYILMITNYSQQPCVINFSKTQNGDPGETDCGILPGIVTNDGPYCEGETIQLDVNEQPNGSYMWTGPNGWTSTLPHPTLENATVAMAGTYSCTTTVGAESTTAETQVIVDPMPDPTASAQPSSINYGAATQLSVDPGAEGDFSFHWEPEDLVVNPNIQNPMTVALTSSQLFTVTVISANNNCTGSAEISIAVGSGLSVTAGADDRELCEGESTTLHAYPASGTGDYTYTWEPAEYLNNATLQNPTVTPPVGTTTFICYVDDGMVTRDASVTILVNPNQVEERHVDICQNESYHFFDPNYFDLGNLNTTGIYEAHRPTVLGCDSLIRLHLTVNPTRDTLVRIEPQCNSYFWDPKGKEYTSYTYYGQEITDETITLSGEYKRVYVSKDGCDSIVRMNPLFEYTPNPAEIIPKDTITSHWLVPATEFQVNTYTFHVYEHNADCHWDRVAWTCTDHLGNDVWTLETYVDSTSSDRKMYYCDLYVLDHIEDTVMLTATAYNGCEPNGVSQNFWIVCSFYGNEEQSITPASFNVVPNPNNGEMTLTFDNLTGKVNIRVYDMNGNEIDNFDTQNEFGHNSLTYSMKQRSAGIYYFVATAKEGTVTKKVVVMQ